MKETTYCNIDDYISLEGKLVNAPQIDVPHYCEDIKLIFGQEVELSESLSPQNINISDQYYGISEFGIIMATLTIYIVTVYLYRNIIVDVIKSTIYLYVAQKNEDNIDSNLSNYIRVAHVLFYIFIAIFLYGLLPDNFSPPFNPELLLPGIVVATLLYLSFRKLAMIAIRYISNNKPLYQTTMLYNRLYKSAWILLFAPISLFSLSSIGVASSVVEYIGIALLLCVIIQQFVRLRLTFKVENISLFQYILYLCTTEFLPISFIVVTITRELKLL